MERQAEVVGHQRKKEEEVGNLKKQRIEVEEVVVVVGEEEVVEVHLHLLLLCWVWMGLEEVGSPQPAGGWAVVVLGAGGCGRRVEVEARRCERVGCVMAVVEVGPLLCWRTAVGVAGLHVEAVGTGCLAVKGPPGGEARARSGPEEAEGPEIESELGPVLEAEALVCQVEVVEALKLEHNKKDRCVKTEVKLSSFRCFSLELLNVLDVLSIYHGFIRKYIMLIVINFHFNI